MTKDEVLKLALEALEEITEQYKLMLTESLDIQHKKYATESPVLKHSSKAITAIKEVLAPPQPWEKFCDSNCVWTDHHPDCKLAEQEPVAMKFKIYKPTVPDPMRQGINNALLPWVYDQDRSSGFDASMWVTPVATLPPQRKPLTDEEIEKITPKGAVWKYEIGFTEAISFARAIEAAVWEKQK